MTMISTLLNSCYITFDGFGSVSDWVMVLIAAMTAIFLVKTFRSQKKIEKLQDQVTKITTSDYTMRYRPEFEILEDIPNPKPAGQNGHSYYGEKFLVFEPKISTKNAQANNVALDYWVTVYNEMGLEVVGENIGNTAPGIDFKLKPPNRVKYQREEDNRANDFIKFRVSISYDDIFGNRYQQIVKGYVTGNKLKCKYSVPQPINRKKID